MSKASNLSVTLFLPIKDGEKARLQEQLTAGAGSDGLGLALSAIKAAHFVYLAIVPAMDDRQPDALMLTARADGMAEDFLADLVSQGGELLNALLGHCVGYPASGLAVPSLVVNYLNQHRLAPDAAYLSNPGTSLGQIHAEHRLHTMLTAQFADFPGTAPVRPTTYRALRRDALASARADDGLAGLEMAKPRPSSSPFHIRRRAINLCLAILSFSLGHSMGVAKAKAAASAPADGPLICLLKIRPGLVNRWRLSLSVKLLRRSLAHADTQLGSMIGLQLFRIDAGRHLLMVLTAHGPWGPVVEQASGNKAAAQWIDLIAAACQSHDNSRLPSRIGQLAAPLEAARLSVPLVYNAHDLGPASVDRNTQVRHLLFQGKDVADLAALFDQLW